MDIEFWYEFASSYSYLAAERVETVAANRGHRVLFRPFLLGPIFAAQGWNDSPFNIYPAKGRYMWRDMERLCAERGQAFRRPTVFPRNGLDAARIAFVGQDEPWIGAFTRAVYRTNYADDGDISDPTVLLGLLGQLGLDAAALTESSRGAVAKQAFRAQNERAVALGVFGAPSFVVDGELFWGDDRLEQAVAWADKRAGH
jgi:2-hydroxychromene-2-carboxylate isomerase